MSEPSLAPIRTWLAEPMRHDVAEAIASSGSTGRVRCPPVLGSPECCPVPWVAPASMSRAEAMQSRSARVLTVPGGH